MTRLTEVCASPAGCDEPQVCWVGKRCAKRRCAYCGRRIATNHRPKVVNGELFHGSCLLDMGDDGRSTRHDIHEGDR